MTILNLYVDGARALIGVDTLAYSSADASVLNHADGKPHEIEKAVVLNRAGCVLASSGKTALLHYLHSHGSRIDGMDAALIELPRLLSGARHFVPLTGPSRGDYPRDRVIIAGWSEAKDRVIAAVYESRNGFETCTSTVFAQGGQGHFSPGVSMLAHPMPDDLPNMLALAQRQCAEYRKDNPAAPFGGRLVVLEVERDAIIVRNLADLGMPAKPAKAEAGVMMQIAAGGATDVLSDKATGATADLTAGAPADVTVTACSISYTNPLNTSITVQVEASWYDAFLYDTLNITTARLIFDQTGTVDGAETVEMEKFGVIPTVGNFPGRTQAWSYTLAGSATMNVYFKIRCVGTTTTCAVNVSAPSLRLTAIKR